MEAMSNFTGLIHAKLKFPRKLIKYCGLSFKCFIRFFPCILLINLLYPMYVDKIVCFSKKDFLISQVFF